MNKKRIWLMLVLVFVLTMAMSGTAFAAKNTNGWVKNGNDTYYYTNGKMVTGWKTIGTNKYYFLKSGKMATGYYKIRAKVYMFSQNGVYKKTLEKAGWEESPQGRRYAKGDGSYYKNRWQNIQGKRYRFNQEGYVLTGMQTLFNHTYYFNSKGVMAASKWVRCNGSIYYFDAKGYMVKGAWVDNRYIGIDGKVITDYVDETRNTKKKTGWKGYGRVWQYFVRGTAITGWKSIEGKRYYFQPSTYMKIGWYNDGKDYYFLNTTAGKGTIGVMATNFMRIDGKVYYFFPKKVKDSTGAVHPKGSMAKNLKIKYNDKYYSFDSKGVCQELK